MGKSYSYSIVVEQAGNLLMNDQEVPLPEEVTTGGNDPLGWALDQVRAIYAQKFADDSTSELNLSVRDRRPGGLVRRARFTNPDAGIDLNSFLQPRDGRGTTVRTGAEAGEADSKKAAPREEKLPEGDEAEASQGGGKRQGKLDEHTTATSSPARSHEERTRERQEPVRAPEPAREPTPVIERSNAVAPSKAPTDRDPGESDSYEERLQKERGWKKLDRNKSTRPQVGSAENEGRSRSQGLLELGKKQKTRNIVAIVVIAVLVIVGFRMFNGGTAYDAVCVDQRTMTRAVTGVACESDMDTNHRWWYVPDSNGVPGVGDTIDQKGGGTFDEPKGSKDTIDYHVENVEGS